MTGSSPRVRGTVKIAGSVVLSLRFIPACAGNGGLPPPDNVQGTVHPRVCGERGTLRPAQGDRGGSSPRVRGTVLAHGWTPRRCRFIPACAGNGDPPALRTSRLAVHPRVCGERLVFEGQDGLDGGSSPRVRGTVRGQYGSSGPGRFIPACAGNGAFSPCSTTEPSVHPRVCGERDRGRPVDLLDDGSSPRVRGTGRSRSTRPGHSRFIPACAGNGARGSLRRRSPSVHPRVCGERVSEHWNRTVIDGSSPRVRGTVNRLDGLEQLRRFIPACAGNGLTVCYWCHGTCRWTPYPPPNSVPSTRTAA